MKILAINPPIFLANAYTLTSLRSFPYIGNFNDAVWTKANKKYKEQYLELRRNKRENVEKPE